MDDLLVIIGGVAALLGALGGMTGIAALINSKADRHAKRADAVEAISQAATVLVTPLAGQVGKLGARIEVLESELRQNRWERQQEAALREAHMEWDQTMVTQADEADLPYTPPPPLVPDDRVHTGDR